MEEVSSWVRFWLTARASLPYLAFFPPFIFFFFLLAHCAFSLSWSFFGAQDILKTNQLRGPFRNPGGKVFPLECIFPSEQNSHSVRTAGAVLLPTCLCQCSLPQQKPSIFSYTWNLRDSSKNHWGWRKDPLGGFRKWHIAPDLLVPGVSHCHWP